MRVIVCCCDGFVRDALAALFRSGGFDVVGVAEDVRTSLSLAGKTGAELLALCARELDRSDGGLLDGAKAIAGFKTLLITKGESRSRSPFKLDRQVSLGDSSDVLFSAVGELRAELNADPSAGPRRRSRTGIEGLTQREQEIALLVARGLSNRAISDQSGLQEQSVKNMVSVIMRKLRCDNRVQIALILNGAPACGQP